MLKSSFCSHLVLYQSMTNISQATLRGAMFQANQTLKDAPHQIRTSNVLKKKSETYFLSKNVEFSFLATALNCYFSIKGMTVVLGSDAKHNLITRKNTKLQIENLNHVIKILENEREEKF